MALSKLSGDEQRIFSKVFLTYPGFAQHASGVVHWWVTCSSNIVYTKFEL